MLRYYVTRTDGILMTVLKYYTWTNHVPIKTCPAAIEAFSPQGNFPSECSVNKRSDPP